MRWLRLGVAAAVPLVFVAGLIEQNRREWWFVQERGFTLHIGAGNVRAFLEDDQKALDDKPGVYVLFPYVESLKGTLNDATPSATITITATILATGSTFNGVAVDVDANGVAVVDGTVQTFATFSASNPP